MSLKLQQIRLAVGVTVKGEPKLLYIGTDASKADEAVAKAGPEFETAGAYPKGVFPVIPRYPAREAAKAKQAAEEVAARAEALKTARKKEAEAKTAQSKQLAAEAAAIQKELSAK